GQLLRRLIYVGISFGDSRMSVNSFKQYNTWVEDTEDQQPGDDWSVDELHMIYAKWPFNSSDDDFFIATQDIIDTSEGITSTNSDKLLGVKHFHTGLPEDESLQKDVREYLND
ncbi:hypothetical protein COV16_05635, partial [Candidatus Woesearchaeota archaeon CG10_big_fil_rev_8_21_14_0_10_34_8]